jgi:hypothetical protein
MKEIYVGWRGAVYVLEVGREGWGGWGGVGGCLYLKALFCVKVPLEKF